MQGFQPPGSGLGGGVHAGPAWGRGGGSGGGYGGHQQDGHFTPSPDQHGAEPGPEKQRTPVLEGFEWLSNRLFVAPAGAAQSDVLLELNEGYDFGLQEKSLVALSPAAWADEAELTADVVKGLRIKGGKAGAKFWKGVRETVMKQITTQDLLLLITEPGPLEPTALLLKHMLAAADTKAAADSLVGLKSGKVIAVLMGWEATEVREWQLVTEDPIPKPKVLDEWAMRRDPDNLSQYYANRQPVPQHQMAPRQRMGFMPPHQQRMPYHDDGGFSEGPGGGYGRYPTGPLDNYYPQQQQQQQRQGPYGGGRPNHMMAHQQHLPRHMQMNGYGGHSDAHQGGVGGPGARGGYGGQNYMMQHRPHQAGLAGQHPHHLQQQQQQQQQQQHPQQMGGLYGQHMGGGMCGSDVGSGPECGDSGGHPGACGGPSFYGGQAATWGGAQQHQNQCNGSGLGLQAGGAGGAAARYVNDESYGMGGGSYGDATGYGLGNYGEQEGGLGRNFGEHRGIGGGGGGGGGGIGGVEMGNASLRSAGERAAADMLWGQAMAPSVGGGLNANASSFNANASSFDYGGSAAAFGGSGQSSRAPSLESASLRAAADSLWMATARAPSSNSNTPPLVPSSSPPPLGLLDLPGLSVQGSTQGSTQGSSQLSQQSWGGQPAANALPSMQAKEADAMRAAAGQLWMGGGSEAPAASLAAAPAGVDGLLGAMSAVPSMPDGLLGGSDLLAQLSLDSSNERPLPGMLPGMPPSLPPSAPTSCDVSLTSTRTASPLEILETHPGSVKCNAADPIHPMLGLIEPLCPLGRGAFGKVLLVRLRTDGQTYALKVLRAPSEATERRKFEVEVSTERDVLASFSERPHPLVVGSVCSFLVGDRCHMLMPFLAGGTLMQLMRTAGDGLPEASCRFYSAQIALALRELHARGILYLDLKLDNVLLSSEGNATLVDFGLASTGLHPEGSQAVKSTGGTRSYMSPEAVLGMHVGVAADWWSLGVVSFEMLVGAPPFVGADKKALGQAIANGRMRFPAECTVSNDARAFVRRLLSKQPQERLGACEAAGGFAELQAQPFFRSIDWRVLEAGELQPPFVPELSHDADTRYFDPKYAQQPGRLSQASAECTGKMGVEPAQFEYVSPDWRHLLQGVGIADREDAVGVIGSLGL